MESSLQEIVQLTGVGLAGVTVYFLYKIVSNHDLHVGKRLEEVAKILERILTRLEDK